MPRTGLVRHRVADRIDRAELRRLAQEMSAARAAEFLGVHPTVVYRIADLEGITFRRCWGYGWRGVR